MDDFRRINEPRVEKLVASMKTIMKSAKSNKASVEDVRDLFMPVTSRLAKLGWIEGHSSFFPWQGARLHVRENHPDGPIEHEVPILDVHRDLWPEHLRRGYEMDEARKAKRRKPPFMTSEPH
jgi:hypothetical protein